MSEFKAPSSMELLLDAMCNVFGSVLFAAILIGGISVTQEIAERSGKVDPEAMRQAEQLDRLLDEQIKNSQLELDLLQSLPLGDTVKKLPDNSIQQRRAAGAVARANDLALELTDLQHKLKNKRAELELCRRLQHDPMQLTEDALQNDITVLEAQIKQSSVAKLDLPETFKSKSLTPWRWLLSSDEFFCIGSNKHIRYGRERNKTIEITRFNYNGSDFFKIIKQPGQGMAYSSEMLASQLENVDRKQHYIEILAEPDAVYRAAGVIDFLRRNNYLYNWRIVPESGAMLRTGTRRYYEVVR